MFSSLILLWSDRGGYILLDISHRFTVKAHKSALSNHKACRLHENFLDYTYLAFYVCRMDTVKK